MNAFIFQAFTIKNIFGNMPGSCEFTFEKSLKEIENLKRSVLDLILKNIYIL